MNKIASRIQTRSSNRTKEYKILIIQPILARDLSAKRFESFLMKIIPQPLFTKRKAVIVTFNLLLFTCLLYWLFHNINFQDLITQIKNAPPKAIIAGLLINIMVLIAYSKRLSIISGADFAPCFLITTLGFTFNSLAPFRIGEAIKIYFGKKRFNYSIGALSASILIEKIYDIISLVIFSIIIITNIGMQIIDLKIIISLCVIIFFGVVCIMVIRTKRELIYDKIKETFIFKKIITYNLFSSNDLRVFDHKIISAALLTAFIWLTNTTLIFILFSLLIPNAGLSLFSAAILLIIAALAIAIPGTPAGIGIFEAGIVSYLINFYNIDKEQALSSAFIYHLVITTPHTLIILFYMVISFLKRTTYESSHGKE